MPVERALGGGIERVASAQELSLEDLLEGLLPDRHVSQARRVERQPFVEALAPAVEVDVDPGGAVARLDRHHPRRIPRTLPLSTHGVASDHGGIEAGASLLGGPLLMSLRACARASARA